MTWFILVVNVLFLFWVIGIGSSVAEECKGLTELELELCEAIYGVGSGIAIGIVIFLWVAADIILLVLYTITNRGQRDCPACGRAVKKGLTVCAGCGHDFAAAAQSDD
tara:strand:+ start:178 stop:501 length:324 start_codon:yes stop_codon:yes gene_type:complete